MQNNQTVQHGDRVRQATSAEIAEWQSAVDTGNAALQAITDQLAAKESAKAKLAALGLTEDEINAIIGGI